MTQPPPGQFPPQGQPGQNPAGGYPPPGAVPPPPPGFQQPAPGYQQPAPGFQQPAPGFPPAGAVPPGQGYPPAGAVPPPGYQPPAGYGAPGSGTPSFDPSKVSPLGWAVVGASLLTLIASFFNFWSVSVKNIYASVSTGYSGWSLWWWIPVLIALAVGVIYLLTLVGVVKQSQVKPEWLFYASAASFVLMILVLIHTFAYDGPGGVFSGLGGLDETGFSSGPGFGVWFALVTTLALTYFALLNAQIAGGKVPFKLPVPAALAKPAPGAGQP